MRAYTTTVADYLQVVEAGLHHLLAAGNVAGVDGRHGVPLATHDTLASIAPAGLDSETELVVGVLVVSKKPRQ